MPKATKARAAERRLRRIRSFCACGRPAVVKMLTEISHSGRARISPWKRGATNPRSRIITDNVWQEFPLCFACQALEIEGCLENHQPLPKFVPVG